MIARFRPDRSLINLALPMLIAQWAVMGNAVIDTLMAGRLSTLDLAAVGLAASIHVTIVMALSGVLFVLPPLIAAHQGAGQPARVGQEMGQSLWVALVLAGIAILLLCQPDGFLAISQPPPAVDAKVRTYLGYSAWGVPGTLAFRLFIGFATGIGQARAVMIFNLISLTLKVPLNALFMYGGLGIPALAGEGCALAASVDAWLIAALAWGWALKQAEFRPFALTGRWPRPDLSRLATQLKLGLPIGLTFLADVTAFTFMALFVARLGPTASAAHQIAANVAVVAFMTPLALGNAAAILIGRALGAGHPAQARHLAMNALGTGVLIGALVSALLGLGAHGIARFYTPATDVITLATPLIGLVAAYHLCDAVQVVAVNALRGYKKTSLPMLIYTGTLWSIGLGGGYLLGLTDHLGPAQGAAGFWLAGAISLALVGLLMTAYLHHVSHQGCQTSSARP